MTSSAARSPEHPLLHQLSLLPGLASLHRALRARLDPQGLARREVAACAGKAEAEAQAKRARFLKARVAWMTVEAMVTKSQLDKVEREEEEEEGDRGGLSIEDKSLQHLSDAFTAMELRDHVRLAGTGEGSATTTLFGLDPERHLRSRPLDPEARTTVHRMMEESLFARATALVRQVEDRVDKEGGEEVASIATLSTTESDADSAVARFSRAVRLPEMVRAEVEAAEDAASARVARRRDAWRRGEERQHLETLSRGVDVLEALCRRHVMGQRAQADEVGAQYLAVKCKTLLLKIKCLELEVLCATYGPEAVQALRRLRAHLDGRAESARTELARVRSALAQYAAAGMEMEEVAEKFAATTAKVEGKRWALRELNQVS